MGLARKELRQWYKSAKCYRFIFQERKTNELWMMCAAQYHPDTNIIIINYVKDGQIPPASKHTISSFINKRLSVRNIVNVDQLNYHLARVQITSKCKQMPSKEVMEEIESFILKCISDSSDSVESLSSNCISDINPQNCADTP